MESDPPAAENSERSPTSEAAARSYECNFCKRGFTNAQALGGHMNIHRKDKANLKLINQCSSNSNQTNLLLDTTPKSNPTPLYSPNPIISTNQPPQSKSTTDLEKNQNKRPRTFPPEVDDAITSRDQTHLGKLSQLPLFSEKSSINSRNYQEPGKGWSSTSSHEQLGPELDLELRLGHEMARDNSSAGTGINKFL